jgi:hypothetical protein
MNEALASFRNARCIASPILNSRKYLIRTSQGKSILKRLRLLSSEGIEHIRRNHKPKEEDSLVKRE